MSINLYTTLFIPNLSFDINGIILLALLIDFSNSIPILSLLNVSFYVFDISSFNFVVNIGLLIISFLILQYLIFFL